MQILKLPRKKLREVVVEDGKASSPAHELVNIVKMTVPPNMAHEWSAVNPPCHSSKKKKKHSIFLIIS